MYPHRICGVYLAASPGNFRAKFNISRVLSGHSSGESFVNSSTHFMKVVTVIFSAILPPAPYIFSPTSGAQRWEFFNFGPSAFSRQSRARQELPAGDPFPSLPARPGPAHLTGSEVTEAAL